MPGTPTAGYMGPENGPFQCARCVHFNAASSTCNDAELLQDKPDGKVEAQGCCNEFEPQGGDAMGKLVAPRRGRY